VQVPAIRPDVVEEPVRSADEELDEEAAMGVVARIAAFFRQRRARRRRS
jgi:hypothetical protein